MSKTNKNHKARFSFGVACLCSCGWSSPTVFGKGAQKEASGLWQIHKASCEEVENNNKEEINS